MNRPYVVLFVISFENRCCLNAGRVSSVIPACF